MRTLRLCIAASAVLTCTLWCCLQAHSTAATAAVIARVGNSTVSSLDLAYRRAVERAYGNEGITEATALLLLVNDALEQEVARVNGVTVTLDELVGLRKHVDESTKAPEILAQVKAAFGADAQAYDRLYLAPRIVNNKLRAWYSATPALHAKQRALIQKAWSLVQAGALLQDAAGRCGLVYKTFDAGGKKADTPAVLQPYVADNATQTVEPFMKVLQGISEGQVHGTIIEDDYGYRVVRLLKKSPPVYSVEAVIVEKAAFDPWFREQAAQVKIAVLDAKFAAGLGAQHPSVPWVKALGAQKK